MLLVIGVGQACHPPQRKTGLGSLTPDAGIACASSRMSRPAQDPPRAAEGRRVGGSLPG